MSIISLHHFLSLVLMENIRPVQSRKQFTNLKRDKLKPGGTGSEDAKFKSVMLYYLYPLFINAPVIDEIIPTETSCGFRRTVGRTADRCSRPTW